MSNAIDILCVGGPANGKMVNLPKPAPTWVMFPAVGGDITYTRNIWEHPTTGKLYHIATRVEDAVTDEQIVAEVVMGNFTPAWDLNK